MSLDVYFYGTEACPHCGGTVKDGIRNYRSNMTHNVHAMVALACGNKDVVWHPEENGITKAGDLIPYLKDAIREFIAAPERYQHLEPDNGGGSIRTTLPWLKEMLDAATEYPDDIVEVSR